MGNDRKLSRREFCRVAAIGGSVFSLSALAYGTGRSQDLSQDVEDDLELVAPDGDVGDYDDTNLPLEVDDPEPGTPGDHVVFLPLLLNQAGGGDGALIAAEKTPTPSPEAGGNVTLEDAAALAASRASSHPERALRAAVAELSYHEEPPGSNSNKFSRYFGSDRHAWCANFVSWAFDSTGYRDKRVPWGNASAASAILDWARAKKHLYRTPRRGDIFVTVKGSVRASGFRPGHCGIVRKVYRTGPLAGKFLAVEGNTFRTLSPHPLAKQCIWVAHGLRVTNLRKANGEYKYYFVRWWA